MRQGFALLITLVLLAIQTRTPLQAAATAISDQAPVVKLTCTPSTLEAGQTVSCSVTATSADSSANAVSLTLDWGDAPASPSSRSPVTSGGTYAHTYVAPGAYRVSVDAQGTSGQTGNAMATITVQQSPASPAEAPATPPPSNAPAKILAAGPPPSRNAEPFISDPAQMHYENSVMRIWASRVYPGIIDVFYKDAATGSWIQFNNVVPVSQVQGADPYQWGNAEINQSQIRTRLLSDQDGVKQIELQFQRFPDGVHFDVIARLEEGKRAVAFRVVPNPDSAPITRFAFGEYFGLADDIRYLEDNGRMYDSTRDWPAPDDGYFKPGYFTTVPLPKRGEVRFWGKSGVVQYQAVAGGFSQSGVVVRLRRVRTEVQYQAVAGGFSQGDELDLEVRQRPWRPEFDTPGNPYGPPGFPWIEMVQIMKQDLTHAEWRVGVELPSRKK